MNRTARSLFILFTLCLSVSALIGAIITNSGVAFFENQWIKIGKEKYEKLFDEIKQDRLYVTTDKSFYKPGETIWFSAFVRDEASLKPSFRSDIINVEFITPKGTVANRYKLIAENGIAKGDIDLTGMVGGLYKIKAFTNFQKNDTSLLLFEKEIAVQQVVVPRLKMKVDFAKKAYGKGDEVVASLTLSKNDNSALANTEVRYIAQIDGKTISEKKAKTDNEGKAQLQFSLPKELSSADGLLNALIEFEGSTESISRSIPIVLNQINLTFYPEGGDMIVGSNANVAFAASNEFGKAADVEGFIVNSKGEFVQKFSSYHNGMGAVSFIPQANETYRARITKPEGILNEYELPEALKNGYALSVLSNEPKSLQLSVYSWQAEELNLMVKSRGKLSFAKAFKAAKGSNVLSLNTEEFPIGVSQITLFDAKGIARSERLVFVNKAQQLNVAISTAKKRYQPREKVAIDVRVTDQNGLPVSGHFALSVTDDNLLSFADDKQGNLLAKMLLEPELKQKVEEPNFYFEAKEPKADKALDYLLLTAGWRHYTWKQLENPQLINLSEQGEKASFGGVVMDATKGQPLAGATIKIKNGPAIMSNKEGKFHFAFINISTQNEIEISAPNFTTQKQTIYAYNTNQYFYIYDKNYRRYEIMDGVEMGMMNVAEARQQRPMAVAMKAGGMKDKKVVLADAEFAPVEAQDLADWEDLPNEPKEEKNVDGDDFIQAKFADERERKLNEADKKNVAPNQAVYYRAKEFPAKSYTSADSTRSDLASTVYWNGDVETDRSGKARVEFVTNDLISSFKTTVEGFGDDGGIGRGELNFATGLPLSIDAKIPTELVSGDKIQLPVFIKNTTDENVDGRVVITSPKQLLIDTKSTQVALAAGETKVIYLSATATSIIGEGKLEIAFDSRSYSDKLTRLIEVSPKGFPAKIDFSGQELTKVFYAKPENIVPGSMRVHFTAFPNIMSELMSGVDAILREPYGCFEQTSSSNYPNIMALQYLRAIKTNNAALEARAKDLLDRGYQKLVSFETKENGYEWFGASPAHEALTAYGLMEFVDMKTVYPKVEDKMLERTAQLLLDKRDGNGGFKKNPRALDSFGGASEEITNAYIVYAMSEAGRGKEIEKEINQSFKVAQKLGDPYLLALMANTMFNIGEKAKADDLLAQLTHVQQENGSWNGKTHSITRSTGQSLLIETTSLVALAIMKSEKMYTKELATAVKFLVNSRSGYGMFGSTQSTILALKALTNFASFNKKTEEAGTIEIWNNGILIASKDYAKGEKENIVISGLEEKIKSGQQKIEVRFKGCKEALPYAMNIIYSTTLPEPSKSCVVELKTSLNRKQAKVGETIRLSATLRNKTKDGQPMTMAIIGLPAGFSAQPWQLKEMQEKGAIDFYEVIGNNIACYFRSLAPEAQKQINFDLKAEIPGEYEAPAASAYLYYTNEHKTWVGLDRVFVNP